MIAVPTSAVAAVLLNEGRTAHSTFKIPILITAKSTGSISARSHLKKELLDTEFIIWDEILMGHRYFVEAVDRSLRDITRRNLPFGGKACYYLETSDKFWQSFPEAPELRLCMLASNRQRYMQAFASYVLQRTCAFRPGETI